MRPRSTIAATLQIFSTSSSRWEDSITVRPSAARDRPDGRAGTGVGRICTVAQHALPFPASAKEAAGHN